MGDGKQLGGNKFNIYLIPYSYSINNMIFNNWLLLVTMDKQFIKNNIFFRSRRISIINLARIIIEFSFYYQRQKLKNQTKTRK